MHSNLSILDQVLNSILPSCAGTKGLSKRLVAAESSGVFATEIYLLVLFLYQALPQFMSCTPIEFAGPLHEKITRNIDIVNQGNQPMSYLADLKKSDFKIKQAEPTNPTSPQGHRLIDTSHSLTISAKGSQKLAIEFLSKFQEPCNEKMVRINSSHFIYRFLNR